MNITRVHDAKGSHIEPPLDPAWDDLAMLTWKAAVVAHDTGITINVCPGNYEIDGEALSGYYNVVVGSTSLGPLNYRSVWDYLSGVTTGARNARRRPATA